MHCAQCQEKISGNPVKQGGEFFCSLECANLAAGYEPEDEESYFEEDELSSDLFERDDE